MLTSDISSTLPTTKSTFTSTGLLAKKDRQLLSQESQGSMQIAQDIPECSDCLLRSMEQ